MTVPSWPHQPVLLKSVQEAFSLCTLHTFIDGTLGAGGHAEALLQKHPEIIRYLGIDQDPFALEIAKKRLVFWQEKVLFQKGNFANFSTYLALHALPLVDGILLDLGVSSMQFDQKERGFSFSQEGPLDMRMDPAHSINAFTIINTWSEKELGHIFRNYGEEKKWRRVARAVIEKRLLKPIETTKELAQVIESVLGWGKKGIHPATLIFQALRIAVNQELKKIEEVIPQAIQALRPGGRLAVISFHSLEDRIVKQQFRYYASDKEDTKGFGGVFLSKEPLVKEITRKPVVASLEEIQENPRSRSAKMRVVERL